MHFYDFVELWLLVKKRDRVGMGVENTRGFHMCIVIVLLKSYLNYCSFHQLVSRNSPISLKKQPFWAAILKIIPAGGEAFDRVHCWVREQQWWWDQVHRCGHWSYTGVHSCLRRVYGYRGTWLVAEAMTAYEDILISLLPLSQSSGKQGVGRQNWGSTWRQWFDYSLKVSLVIFFTCIFSLRQV